MLICVSSLFDFKEKKINLKTVMRVTVVYTMHTIVFMICTSEKFSDKFAVADLKQNFDNPSNGSQYLDKKNQTHRVCSKPAYRDRKLFRIFCNKYRRGCKTQRDK